MPTILPIQSRFDKVIPDNFGNGERVYLVACYAALFCDFQYLVHWPV